MPIGGQGGDAPARCALQKALLDQVGLNHVFDGFALLGNTGGDVVQANRAAIKAVKPGADFIDYHDAATRVLAQGFIDLKLCKGSVDKVLEDGSYKQFYMHRTGHWLGLDVHDAGDYMRKGKWRKLKPGMVLTVEPGCYIRPADNVPKAFWNIGVRIEDDVLVTAAGREVLTASCPKSVADIESLTAR